MLVAQPLKKPRKRCVQEICGSSLIIHNSDVFRLVQVCSADLVLDNRGVC